MMDITSFQSIQQQLGENQFPISLQKSEYIHNLKSQCLFKQNALKTAENLIEEYFRQNEELKLEVIRLTQKVDNYEERIQILKHQIQNKDVSSAKSYQKELFKASYKLTKVLEKYSELQQKYHQLQKQVLKLKSYKKKNEQKIIRQENQKQQQFKKHVEKQFDNFLRTPVNKSSRDQTNPSTKKKPSYSMAKNNDNQQRLFINNLEREDLSSSSVSNPKLQDLLNSSSENTKIYIEQPDKKYFNRSQSIKKSVEKLNKICLKEKSHRKYQDSQINELSQSFEQKIKILEWRLKEKDEQIMLMLRRNKQVEGKYELLKEIMKKEKSQSEGSSQDSIPLRKKQPNSRPKKLNPQEIERTESNQMKKQSIKTNGTNISPSIKSNQRNKITHFSTSLNNDSTDHSTWKNFHVYHYS